MSSPQCALLTLFLALGLSLCARAIAGDAFGQAQGAAIFAVLALACLIDFAFERKGMYR